MDRGNSDGIGNIFSNYQDFGNYIREIWTPRVSRVRQRSVFRQRGVQVVLVQQWDKATDLSALSPIFKQVGREGSASRKKRVEEELFRIVEFEIGQDIALLSHYSTHNDRSYPSGNDAWAETKDSNGLGEAIVGQRCGSSDEV